MNEEHELTGEGVYICKAAFDKSGALMLIPNQDLNMSEELAILYDKISELAKKDAATIRETIERERQARDN